ncbi:MAG TPA: tetratricopeptide repeat protein [Stellaceae bacterium]|nr:tetratricopeptide repeat protein [Stellaceae bacterium]
MSDEPLAGAIEFAFGPATGGVHADANETIAGLPEDDRVVEIAHWRAAVDADPHRGALRERLVVALMAAGAFTEAEAEAKRFVEGGSDDAIALNLLGLVNKRMGRLAEAIATFERAAGADPRRHVPWYNLGNTLLAAGAPARAIEPLKRAVQIKPTDSETVRLLGAAFAQADRLPAAMAIFDRAQKLDPTNSRVYASRAGALERAGASDAAVIGQFNRALALAPDSREHLRAKSAFLIKRRRFSEAEEVLRTLLRIDSDDIDTLLRLGHLLGYALRRYEEGNSFLRRALGLRPGDARCLSTLCNSLLDSRYGNEAEHLEEAGALGRRLLAVAADRRPYSAALSGVFLRLADFESLSALGNSEELVPYWIDHMNVGALHNQLGRVVTAEDRRALVAWHREWGRRAEAAAVKSPVRPPPSRPMLRDKIRVGIMSSDLRDHPVCYFALPIFEHYDRARFEITCYSFYPEPPDQVQSFIQQRVALFRSLTQASDAEVAQRIGGDDLDILFELGGSTRFNRLEVLAYRPAPMQVSWLGYPHSAGLATIDRILVDPYLKPEDPALLIEQPFEMPESWVAIGRIGFRDVPIEPGVPEDRTGVITFGTMNNPYKYTPSLFQLWAETMRRVPNSRFLFVRPEGGAASFRANVCHEFGRHGIADDRIAFEPVRGAHLPHYNRIDIALDTAPQTGGTTTCEALWMGVPTVTLVGEAFFERMSRSNLTNAGLADLCASTRERYVDIAEALAQNRERRLDLRHTMRARVRHSPLGDAQRWVRNFELAIESTLATT